MSSIYGIGVDIVEVKRFEKWIQNENLLNRFFNEDEKSNAKSHSALCQHYAVRFAAKEAFSKAIGTGITGFELKDAFIKNDKNGKPKFIVTKSALKVLEAKCGKSAKIQVSLSHEKQYAVAFVIITH